MFTPGMSTCTEHITHAEVTAQAKWTSDLSKLNSSWVQCYAAKGSSDCWDSCKRGDSTRYQRCKSQTSQHWSPIMISERQSNPSKKYLTQIFFLILTLRRDPMGNIYLVASIFRWLPVENPEHCCYPLYLEELLSHFNSQVCGTDILPSEVRTFKPLWTQNSRPPWVFLVIFNLSHSNCIHKGERSH